MDVRPPVQQARRTRHRRGERRAAESARGAHWRSRRTAYGGVRRRDRRRPRSASVNPATHRAPFVCSRQRAVARAPGSAQCHRPTACLSPPLRAYASPRLQRRIRAGRGARSTRVLPDLVRAKPWRQKYRTRQGKHHRQLRSRSGHRARPEVYVRSHEGGPRQLLRTAAAASFNPVPVNTARPGVVDTCPATQIRAVQRSGGHASKTLEPRWSGRQAQPGPSSTSPRRVTSLLHGDALNGQGLGNVRRALHHLAFAGARRLKSPRPAGFPAGARTRRNSSRSRCSRRAPSSSGRP